MISVLGWVGLRTRARRTAVDELNALSGPQLADLGITRDQIAAYVDGDVTPSRYRGKPTLRVIIGGRSAA